MAFLRARVRSFATLRVYALLIACFFVNPIKAGILQGPVFNVESGHLYYLLDQNTWTASEAEAINLGGHLATIRNAAEQEWIFRVFGEGFGGNRLLWIGLNSVDTGGAFHWSSGEPFTFSDWAVGEPNHSTSDENFAALYYKGHSSQELWNDWPDLSSDPIGIPFMGVVEIAPENFKPELISPAWIDFEDFTGVSFFPGPVPLQNRLSDQMQFERGVRFSSSDGAVAIVNLGPGHASSGTNGIGGLEGGSLNYAAALEIIFTMPGAPAVPAMSDFVSIRIDQLGGAGPISMLAYNYEGALLGQTNVADVGGGVIVMAIPGIHRVVVQGNGSSAFDELFFNGLQPVLPSLNTELKEGSLRLHWDAVFANYILEASLSLGADSQWTTVNVMEANGQYVAQLIPSAKHYFFRLRMVE